MRNDFGIHNKKIPVENLGGNFFCGMRNEKFFRHSDGNFIA